MHYSCGNILYFRRRACWCWLNTTPVFRRNSVRCTCSFKNCLFGELWIVFWRHHAHVKLEMPFFILSCFSKVFAKLLVTRIQSYSYLPCSACHIALSLFRAKATSVVNEEIPKRNSFRDLTCGNSLPCSDFSLAPDVWWPHLVYLQVQGRPLLPCRNNAHVFRHT